jgi:hypothetical protein
MNPITLIAFHPTGYELHIPVSLRRTACDHAPPGGAGLHAQPGAGAHRRRAAHLPPAWCADAAAEQATAIVWFSHKLVHPETGETVYCRGYASASSPGYDILLPTAVPASSSCTKQALP